MVNYSTALNIFIKTEGNNFTYTRLFHCNTKHCRSTHYGFLVMGDNDVLAHRSKAFKS